MLKKYLCVMLSVCFITSAASFPVLAFEDPTLFETNSTIISSAEEPQDPEDGTVWIDSGYDDLTQVSALPIGSKLVDPETAYNGEPILWLVVDQNHYDSDPGYPLGATTLASFYCLDKAAFDAMEPENPEDLRRDYGNNNWWLSNIRQWLNADEEGGEWYTAAHNYDAPPTAGNLIAHQSASAYFDKMGFLSNLSNGFQDLLQETTLSTQTEDSDMPEDTAEPVRIFLPGLSEISDQSTPNEPFDYFTDTAKRVTQFSNSNGAATNWWTRDALRDTYRTLAYVQFDGTVSSDHAYDSLAVRPFCNINGQAYCIPADSASEAAYQLVFPDSVVYKKYSAAENEWSEVSLPDVAFPNGVINNDYFGIVTDNEAFDAATNNVSAFNRAIALAKMLGLDVVRLQTGTYYVDTSCTETDVYISHSISLLSGMTLDLNQSELIQIANNSERYALIMLSGKTDVTVKNGTLIGDKEIHDYVDYTDYGQDPEANPSTHEWGYGIEVRGSQNVTIEAINAHDMTGDGIEIGGLGREKTAQNVTVKDCDFSDCRRQGISVTGADNVEITGCKISGIGGTAPGAGIDLEADPYLVDGDENKREPIFKVSRVNINGCEINETHGSSINVNFGTENIVIDGNELDHGIYLNQGLHVDVKNNTVTGGLIYSDYFYAYSGAPDQIMIQQNTLKNASIHIQKVPHVIIQENTVEDGQIHLAYSSGVIYHNDLRKITADETLRAGIWFYYNVDDFPGADYPFTVYYAKNTIIGYPTPLSGAWNNPDVVNQYTDSSNTELQS